MEETLLVVSIKKAAPTNASTMTCATIPSFHKNSANFRGFQSSFYSILLRADTSFALVTSLLNAMVVQIRLWSPSMIGLDGTWINITSEMK